MGFKYPVYQDSQYFYSLGRSILGGYSLIMIPRDQGISGQGQTVNLLRIRTLEMALRYLMVYAHQRQLQRVFEPEGEIADVADD